MISDRLLLVGLYLVVVVVAVIVLNDDGMTRCQTTHSFDVCHDALH